MKQFLFVTLVTLGTVIHAADATFLDKAKNKTSEQITSSMNDPRKCKLISFVGGMCDKCAQKYNELLRRRQESSTDKKK